MNTVTPILADLYGVVQPFIVSVTGLDASLVIEGLDNRVATPAASPGFITYQAILQKRLNTNIETWDPTDPAPTIVSAEMHVDMLLQIDCYGAASLSWATMLQTLLRSNAGCVALAPVCQPLYTDDPHMMPLDDTEEQYEQRWVVEAHIQYNPVTGVTVQFANALNATLIEVQEAYGP